MTQSAVQTDEPYLDTHALNKTSSVHRIDLNGCDTTQIKDTLEMFHTIIVDRVDTTGVKAYFSISVVFVQAKYLNDVTDPPVPLCSNVSTILGSTNVNEEFNGIYNQLIEDFERNGSGWIIQLLFHLDLSKFVCCLFVVIACLSISFISLSIYLSIYMSVYLSGCISIYIFFYYYNYNYNFILDMTVYDPIHASSYLPLPQILKNKKTLINIQNNDENAFCGVYWHSYILLKTMQIVSATTFHTKMN